MNLKQMLINRLPLSNHTISIRQFQQYDISANYISWLNDAEVVRYSNQRFITHTQHSCEQFYHSMGGSDSVFLLIQDSNATAVGTITVHFNPNHKTADVGILLGEKRTWGQGIGKAAWQTVIHALTELPELRKITAGTLACNAPMLALIKSTNMTADGIRQQQELVDGKAVDIHHFALFTHSSD